MGLGRSLRRAWRQVRSNVQDVYQQASSNLADAEDSGLTSTALAAFANPLVAQDIYGASLGGALSRGADARTAFTQAGRASESLAAGGSSQQWADLGAFNAALLAGAATGGMTSQLIYGGSGIAGLTGATGTVAGSVTGSLLAGGATYAGAQALANANYGGSGGDEGGSAPPDVAATYANDPSTAAQFQRLRKAARSLGRAGTFKNKGSGTTLGLGDSVLGDQLSLIGS